MNILILKQQQTDANFKITYEKYVTYVRKIIYSHCGCFDATNDITQNVFIDYLQKMNTVNNAKSWLAKAAYWQVCNYNKYNMRFVNIQSDEYEDCMYSQNKIDATIMIEKAFSKIDLNDTDKTILYNYIYDKEYLTDIAKKLGLTRRIVEYRYKTALKKLKYYFESIGIKSVTDFL